jgi:hypothetical protein
MSSDETSKLTESVPEGLLVDDSVEVYLSDGEKIVSQYSVATELKNPYDFDPGKFLPNSTPMSLNRFFTIARELISDAQSREGVVDGSRVILTEEYPPEPFRDLGDELVAYRVLRREPAKMNAKGTGRPQRKSMYYYDIIRPENPNKAVVIESRPVDHIIEFTCWGKTNKLANARAIWLEKLFINHAWAFVSQGVERFYWRDRGPDTYMTSGGQRLFYRPINFFVRFREFEVKATSLLKQIDLNFGLGGDVLSLPIQLSDE